MYTLNQSQIVTDPVPKFGKSLKGASINRRNQAFPWSRHAQEAISKPIYRGALKPHGLRLLSLPKKVDGSILLTVRSALSPSNMPGVVDLNFSSPEREKFSEIMSGIPYKQSAFENYADIAARAMVQSLTQENQEKLKAIRDLQDLRMLHVLPNDLQLDAIPKTGKLGDRIESRKTHVNEAATFALLELTGFHAYRHFVEHEGRVIHDVYAREGKKSEKSSQGGGDVPIHSESSSDVHPPEQVGFNCIISDGRTETPFYPLASLFNKLTPDEINTLRKPIFEVVAGSDKTVSYKGPLLESYSNSDKSRFRWSPKLVTSNTAEGRKIIEKISGIFKSDEFQKTKMVATLENGEMCFFLNACGKGDIPNGFLHARGPIFDSLNRWQQRSFASSKETLRESGAIKVAHREAKHPGRGDGFGR